ncbi:hypothetical protein A5733_13550 [Mycobacterium sp. NS-7484]|nr:hypothetical protein A5699_02040 [Mycobacterium sp. E802]OMB95139.1 hypothetical protein A5733_13550 [Mycobacterium sp. NS-7484]
MHSSGLLVSRLETDVESGDRGIIGIMSAVLWVLVGVFAVGVIAGGLLRIRAWLAKPVPPEVIEAAHRDDDKDG